MKRIQYSYANILGDELAISLKAKELGLDRKEAQALHYFMRYPSNWRKDFDTLKLAIGYGTPTEKQPHLKLWPEDVMRHTAVSHHFRRCSSYGETAEQFGNSEAIIKNHYQGRVTSEETKRFYALSPKKGAGK